MKLYVCLSGNCGIMVFVGLFEVRVGLGVGDIVMFVDFLFVFWFEYFV